MNIEIATPATPVQHVVSTPTLWEDDVEQCVDEMIKRGRTITADAIEKYKPVAIFGGFSGGDDSIVACHFAVEQFGAAVAHVNTETGVKQTRDHVQKLVDKYGWHLIEKHAVAQGPPKHTRKYINGKRENLPFDPSTLPTGKWQDGATAFEEFCVNFGMPGPGMHGRMYQRLKERQFNAIRRDAKRGKHKHDCIMILTGIRQDESAIRAGYRRAVSKVGGTVWVNPFYYSNAAEFELYRQEFGLPRNPVKPVVGVSGDCLCGTFADDPNEVERAGTLDPARHADMQRIEGRCESLGLPCKWGTRPPKNQRTDDLQLTLFGDEPTFQPACVGCMRRKKVEPCNK